MKKVNVLYWVFTGLFAAMMLFSTIPNLTNSPDAVKLICEQLGYPEYFVRYIGIAKLLGIIALLIPTRSSIKEWAYAGLMFDLISAVYSFIAIGLHISDWFPMIIFFIPGVLSFVFYHRRKAAKNMKTSLA